MPTFNDKIEQNSDMTHMDQPSHVLAQNYKSGSQHKQAAEQIAFESSPEPAEPRLLDKAKNSAMNAAKALHDAVLPGKDESRKDAADAINPDKKL